MDNNPVHPPSTRCGQPVPLTETQQPAHLVFRLGALSAATGPFSDAICSVASGFCCCCCCRVLCYAVPTLPCPLSSAGVGKSTLLANLLGHASIAAQLSAASAGAAAKRDKSKSGKGAKPSASSSAMPLASPPSASRSSPFKPTAAPASSPPKTYSITSTKVRILADGVPLTVTLIDSPGYGDQKNVEASFDVFTKFLDARLQESLEQEQSVTRSAEGGTLRKGGVDVILYFIAPHRLKGLDVELLSRLTHRAPVVPIISKADTLTADELATFRVTIAEDLESAGIQVFHRPLAVISGPNGSRDRVYPWGTAHAENTTHSDLPALRRLLLVDGLKDLHVARRACYEAFRTKVLRQRQRRGLFRQLTTAVRRAGLYTAVLVVVLPGMRQVLAEGVLGGMEELSQNLGELLVSVGAERKRRDAGRSAAAVEATAKVPPTAAGRELVVAPGEAKRGPLRKLWALGALLAAPLVLLLRRPPTDTDV